MLVALVPDFSTKTDVLYLSNAHKTGFSLCNVLRPRGGDKFSDVAIQIDSRVVFPS